MRVEVQHRHRSELVKRAQDRVGDGMIAAEQQRLAGRRQDVADGEFDSLACFGSIAGEIQVTRIDHDFGRHDVVAALVEGVAGR